MGKLALFGIGKHISIITTKADDDFAIKFELNWDEILSSEAIYFPKFESIKKQFPKGTKITLSELTRISDFDASKTALSLSKMFNCFDEKFRVKVKRNDEPGIELTREMRFSDLEIQKNGM